MHRLTIRLLIAICTFALGITIVALWAHHYFDFIKDLNGPTSKGSPPPSQTEANIPPGWEKVDMDGKATFFIPPGLRRVNRDPNHLYRDFRSDSMQFFTMYTNQDGGATCVVQNRERAEKKPGLSEITIDGRNATIQYFDKTTFEIYQPEPVLKGLTICVTDVGDGEHEFGIVAKFKGDQDYQIVRRIIDSIKFSQTHH
jgi:hypothetical protein